MATGLEEMSTATSEGAEASERVAHRCAGTAESADRIDTALDAIEQRRSRQTEMVAEIDRALGESPSAHCGRLAQRPAVPSAFSVAGSTHAGFPQGGRGVVVPTNETTDEDVTALLVALVAAAVDDGYAVSLSPPPALDRRTLQRGLGEAGYRFDRLLEENRLFVIDLFETWADERNVFDVTEQSLEAANERIASRREDALLVIGNIAGEIHAFGEQATRETTYNNDGGVLESADTVVNVVDETVSPSLTRFYIGAADVVARVEPGPAVEMASETSVLDP